jgi:hypothetical protein
MSYLHLLGNLRILELKNGHEPPDSDLRLQLLSQYSAITLELLFHYSLDTLRRLFRRKCVFRPNC